ncbi:hypothetical protein [Luteimonas sp. R10]|uniref:hypothetical protein n=1 Tax=Luteimonas sp. R10 TaxID=3108176 RepID=UPI0030885D85|nr:hypothetical protein U3649_05040 [Luteimonas sp. R10]
MLVGLPFAAGCTQPRGTYQEARVLLVDGVPCFAAADNDEARKSPPILAGLAVYEWEADKARILWNRSFPDSPPLSPDDCITYDPDSSDAAEDFSPLQPGNHYSVEINSHVPDGKSKDGGVDWKNRVYSADFCLITDQEGGTPRVYQVGKDESGRRDWSSCFAAGERGTTP